MDVGLSARAGRDLGAHHSGKDDWVELQDLSFQESLSFKCLNNSCIILFLQKLGVSGGVQFQCYSWRVSN